MNTHLREDVDFRWVEKQNPFGYVHQYPELLNGTILKRIHKPSSHSIVLLHTGDYLKPVLIRNGEYEVQGRVSNHWSWREINEDLTVGELQYGYGFFYEPHMKFITKQTIEIKTDK